MMCWSGMMPIQWMQAQAVAVSCLYNIWSEVDVRCVGSKYFQATPGGAPTMTGGNLIPHHPDVSLPTDVQTTKSLQRLRLGCGTTTLLRTRSITVNFQDRLQRLPPCMKCVSTVR